MQPDVPDFIKRVGKIRREHLPSSDRIVAETFERLEISSTGVSKDSARQRFNALLWQVFIETLRTLESYERPVYSELAIQELARIRAADLDNAYAEMRAQGSGEAAFQRAVQQLISTWYFHLRQLFLSVSQSRKTRGGRDFELQLGLLLKLAGFPYEAQHRQHRVDFMLPDYQHYSRDRTQCVLVSAKRTLRERWQQVVDELHKMNCPNVFLATTDEVISASKIADISQRNIKIVVFDEAKQANFAGTNMVVSYSFLAQSVLPQWQTFW